MSQNRFLWGVIVVSIAVVLLLSGCFEEKYRYVCQNPDKFDLPECQKPRCLFTQTCPEYLVAPILTNKIDPPKAEEKKAEAPNATK
jgi:hypothetical protein